MNSKSYQSRQTVGSMVWVASWVWNPNLLKQFTEVNDPVKQMLAGLNKSLEVDNRAIINRVVKAEQSISKWQHFKDNHTIITSFYPKNWKVRHLSFLFGIPNLCVAWPWFKRKNQGMRITQHLMNCDSFDGSTLPTHRKIWHNSGKM